MLSDSHIKANVICEHVDCVMVYHALSDAEAVLVNVSSSIVCVQCSFDGGMTFHNNTGYLLLGQTELVDENNFVIENGVLKILNPAVELPSGSQLVIACYVGSLPVDEQGSMQFNLVSNGECSYVNNHHDCLTPCIPTAVSGPQSVGTIVINEGDMGTYFCTSTNHAALQVKTHWFSPYGMVEGLIIEDQILFFFSANRIHAGEYGCNAVPANGTAINSTVLVIVNCEFLQQIH